jgi:hypothetical protein
MRLQFGGGYLTTSESTGGSTLKVSGGAGSFGMAVGGAVIENLIIYGEFTGMFVSDPSVSYRGNSATASGTTMTLSAFGPGVAYYIEPFNMYLSGTMLFAKLSMSNSDSNDNFASSDLGFGAHFNVGKEWWVSTNWGLGAAFQFQFASMKDKGVDDRITALGFAALFSATYN